MRELNRVFLLLLLGCLIMVANLALASTRGVINRYSQTDEDSILFVAGTSMGMLIPAGQSLEFVIPAQFKERLPNFACIKHRKDDAFMADKAAPLDPDSPWLTVDFHNPVTGEWVSWQDQFGREKRSARASFLKPKQNTLYNYPEYVGRFSPDRVRVTNRGSGKLADAVASFHSLELTYLTAGERSEAVKKTITGSYELLNSLTVRYTLDAQAGVELKPGSGIEFIFPQIFKDRDILHVVLKHRKDPRYAADPGNFDAIDPDAAYILCEARGSLDHLWYRWADRSSFAKFSEVRSADNPENETLHNGLRTFGRIKPDRFRITNVGTGNPEKAIASIHELEITFTPSASATRKIEHIFTPETAFGDVAAGKPVPLIGGGPRIGGKFPGAVLLGKNRHKRQQKIQALTEEYRFDVCASPTIGAITSNGNFLLSLPAGCRLEQVELVIGDLDLTSLEVNKDGYFGRSGSAQVSVQLVTSDGSNVALIENNNVGMAGMVICGGPVKEYFTGERDKLLIKVDNDEAFLMGFRITLSEP